MTLDKAKQVLAAMSQTSMERYTPDEREAMLVIGAAWKMGQLTDEQAAEYFGVRIEELRPN